MEKQKRQIELRGKFEPRNSLGGYLDFCYLKVKGINLDFLLHSMIQSQNICQKLNLQHNHHHNMLHFSLIGY
jgi:hypothetical protein